MATGDPTTVNEGDLAFARSVQDLADIFIGRRPTRVRFTRWSSPDDPTLHLANRTNGGPILWITEEDLETPVMTVDSAGIRYSRVDGWFDFKYQGAAPGAPVAANTLRMYVRAGQVYFKTTGSGELQIPVGAPPGPTLRYAFWMA